MSRIVQFTRAPEVLEFKDIQIPAPADNEVRIKVKAIGLNRAESIWRGRVAPATTISLPWP
jgi:NADPH:quinone reductase-like Zn-dependent oxidoreductase